MVTIDTYPLEKRRIIKKILVATLFGVILVGLFYAIDWFFVKGFDLAITYYFIPIVFIFIFELFYQIMSYRRLFYDLTPGFLTLRTGVVCRVEYTLPYKSIHSLYVDQDFFDRIFGIWDLHITLLNSKVRCLHFDGLSGANARFIRDALLKKLG